MEKTLKEQALEMLAEGASIRQTAKALGVSPGTVSDYRKAKTSNRKLKEDGVAEIIDLHRQGHSERQIAEEVGIARGSVNYHLREHDPLQYQTAEERASNLRDELVALITRSMYPVINHDTIMVRANVRSRFKEGEVSIRSGAPEYYNSARLRVKPVKAPKCKRYLFTCAQNDTPIHEGLWANMKAYAKLRNAEIVVGTSVYNTNWWNETNISARQFHEALHPHLCFGQMEIGDHFAFAGEMNFSPTTADPLGGLIGYARNKWMVFPASRMALKTVPTTDPKASAAQIMTSGSITLPKVAPRAPGQKAIHHHVLGFVVVEFDQDGDIFARHVNAESDGSFYDMIFRAENGKVGKSKERPDYLMPGDVHRAKLDCAPSRDVTAIFGFVNEKTSEKNLISLLKPKHVLLHDLHDGEVDSHWTQNDLHHSVEMHARGRGALETEIEGDGLFLQRLSKLHKDTEFLVVESNHDLRVNRYIKEGRYRNAQNLAFGLHLDRVMLDNRSNPNFSPLEWAIREKFALDRVKWLYDGQSHVINEVEVGHHGFRGTNGTKATISGYVRQGVKITYGDKHAPEIRDGAFQGGVIALQQGYNKGPSSWAVSAVLQYANGKRCIVTINRGKFWFP